MNMASTLRMHVFLRVFVVPGGAHLHDLQGAEEPVRHQLVVEQSRRWRPASVPRPSLQACLRSSFSWMSRTNGRSSLSGGSPPGGPWPAVGAEALDAVAAHDRHARRAAESVGLVDGGRDLHVHPLVVHLVAGDEQVSLAGEQAVEQLAGDADVSADVVDAGPSYPCSDETAGGRLEDRVARVLALPAPPGRPRSGRRLDTSWPSVRADLLADSGPAAFSR